MTAALRNTQATPNLRPVGLALTGLIAAGALLAGLAGTQSATTPKATPQANALAGSDHDSRPVVAPQANTLAGSDHDSRPLSLLQANALAGFDHDSRPVNLSSKVQTWQDGVNTYTGFKALPTFTVPAVWDDGGPVVTSNPSARPAGGPSRLRVR